MRGATSPLCVGYNSFSYQSAFKTHVLLPSQVPMLPARCVIEDNISASSVDFFHFFMFYARSRVAQAV
jgi:hypothetical protein